MKLVKNAGYMQLVKNAMWRPENNLPNYVIVNTHFEIARSLIQNSAELGIQTRCPL
jgi:hypothetical protein